MKQYILRHIVRKVSVHLYHLIMLSDDQVLASGLKQVDSIPPGTSANF